MMTRRHGRVGTAPAERDRIARELGAGGLATGCLAEDLRHPRQVALKVLKPEVAAALNSDRFLREIETAAQLAHPHTRRALTSGRAPDPGGPREAHLNGVRARNGAKPQEMSYPRDVRASSCSICSPRDRADVAPSYSSSYSS